MKAAMGREIRMVPPGWVHPQRDPNKNPYRHEGKQPMYDETFDAALATWAEDFDRVRAGKFTDDEREWYPRGMGDWLKDHPPPDIDYYRPWKDDEATWFQLWETVSEGTPVSPPFATKQELANYLAANGDEWDRSRCNDPHSCKLFGLTPGKPGWGKETAERFVFGPGWAPSFVLDNGKLMSGVEAVTQK